MIIKFLFLVFNLIEEIKASNHWKIVKNKEISKLKLNDTMTRENIDSIESNKILWAGGGMNEQGIEKILKNIKDEIQDKEFRISLFHKLCPVDQSACYKVNMKIYTLNRLKKLESKERIEFVKYWSDYPKKNSDEKFPFELFKGLIEGFVDGLPLQPSISFNELNILLNLLTKDSQNSEILRNVMAKNFVKKDFVNYILGTFKDPIRGIKNEQLKNLIKNVKNEKKNIFPLQLALDQYCMKSQACPLDYKGSKDSQLYLFMNQDHLNLLLGITPIKTLQDKIKKRALELYKSIMEKYFFELNQLATFIDGLNNEIQRKENPFDLKAILIEMISIDSLMRDYHLRGLNESFNNFKLKALAKLFNKASNLNLDYEFFFESSSFDENELIKALLMSNSIHIDTFVYLEKRGIKIDPSEIVKLEKSHNTEAIFRLYGGWIFRNHGKNSHGFNNETFINGIQNALRNERFDRANEAINTCNTFREMIKSSKDFNYERYVNCFEAIYWNYFSFNDCKIDFRIRKRMFDFLINRIILLPSEKQILLSNENQDHCPMDDQVIEIVNKKLDYDLIDTHEGISFEQVKNRINLSFKKFLEISKICVFSLNASPRLDPYASSQFIETIRNLYLSLDLRTFNEWNLVESMNFKDWLNEPNFEKSISLLSSYASEMNCKGGNGEIQCNTNGKEQQIIIQKFKTVSKYHLYLTWLGKRCKATDKIKENFKSEDEKSSLDQVALLWALATINKPDCSIASEIFEI